MKWFVYEEQDNRPRRLALVTDRGEHLEVDIEDDGSGRLTLSDNVEHVGVLLTPDELGALWRFLS